MTKALKSGRAMLLGRCIGGDVELLWFLLALHPLQKELYFSTTYPMARSVGGMLTTVRLTLLNMMAEFASAGKSRCHQPMTYISLRFGFRNQILSLMQ